MADTRTCFAGDLTSDAIGKIVFFEHDVEPGVTTMYKRVLLKVTHDQQGSRLYLEGRSSASNLLGPIAASMGVSLKETAGVLFLLSQRHIIGEQAGTSLRGMLSSLTSPSKQANEEINRLGITLYDSQGAFLGLENVAGQLSDAYSGMTQQSRDASLGILFGNEQVPTAIVLLAAYKEGLTGWATLVNDNSSSDLDNGLLIDSNTTVEVRRSPKESN